MCIVFCLGVHGAHVCCIAVLLEHMCLPSHPGSRRGSPQLHASGRSRVTDSKETSLFSADSHLLPFTIQFNIYTHFHFIYPILIRAWPDVCFKL